MHRRTYLGAVAMGALAGCLGDDGTTGGDENETDGTTGRDENETDGTTGGDENGTDGTTGGGGVQLFDQRWTRSLGLTGYQTVRYTATVNDDRVFVGNGGGLSAFTVDGRRAWQRERPQGYDTLLADETGVVALTDDDTLLEVEVSSGQTRWSAEVDRVLDTGLTDQSVLVRTGSQEVRRYDRTGGESESLSRVPGGPVFGGDGVGVVSGSFELVGIDPVSGDQRWTTEVNSPDSGVLADGTVVVVGSEPGSSGDDELTAVDAQSGAVRWEQSIEAVSDFAELNVVGDVVAFVGEDDRLRVYDFETGARRWEVSLGDIINPLAPPVGRDGVLVAERTRNGESEFVAFGTETGEVLGTTESTLVLGAGVATGQTFFECGRSVTAYGLATDGA